MIQCEDGRVNWTTKVENDPEGRRYYQEELDDMLDALQTLAEDLDETIEAIENGQLTADEGEAKLKEAQYWSMMADQDIEEMQGQTKFLRSAQPLPIIAKLRTIEKVICYDDLEEE